MQASYYEFQVLIKHHFQRCGITVLSTDYCNHHLHIWNFICLFTSSWFDGSLPKSNHLRILAPYLGIRSAPAQQLLAGAELRILPASVGGLGSLETRTRSLCYLGLRSAAALMGRARLAKVSKGNQDELTQLRHLRGMGLSVLALPALQTPPP